MNAKKSAVRGGKTKKHVDTCVKLNEEVMFQPAVMGNSQAASVWLQGTGAIIDTGPKVVYRHVAWDWWGPFSLNTWDFIVGKSRTVLAFRKNFTSATLSLRVFVEEHLIQK